MQNKVPDPLGVWYNIFHLPVKNSKNFKFRNIAGPEDLGLLIMDLNSFFSSDFYQEEILNYILLSWKYLF